MSFVDQQRNTWVVLFESWKLMGQQSSGHIIVGFATGFFALMFDRLRCHEMMAQSCYTQQPQASATTKPASKQPRSHGLPTVLSCLEEGLPHGVHQGFVVPQLCNRWSWLEGEVNPSLVLLENGCV